MTFIFWETSPLYRYHSSISLPLSLPSEVTVLESADRRFARDRYDLGAQAWNLEHYML